MAFSIRDKSKKEKFGYMLGLVFLATAISKIVPIKFDVEHIHIEPVSISELNFKNKDDLLVAISKYQINMNGVENEAKKVGISVEDFQKLVKLNIAVSESGTGPKEITLEFDSNIQNKDLTPIYKYIATDMKNFLDLKQ